jgi:hypothetical protein
VQENRLEEPIMAQAIDRDEILDAAYAQYDARVGRLFAPERATLAAASRVLEECVAERARPTQAEQAAWTRWRVETAAHAWEALAARGVIPQHWIADPARRFMGWRECAIVGADGVRTLDLSHEAASPIPLDPTTVLTLASDTSGIGTVEALVREWCIRTAHWGWSDRADAPVLWRVEARATPPYVHRPELRNILTPMERALGLENPAFDPYAESSAPLIWFATPVDQARLSRRAYARPMIWQSKLLESCILSTMWATCVES